MLRFLFWNIGRAGIEGYVAKAVSGYRADVLMLAECVDPVPILQSLHAAGLTNYFHHHNPTAPSVEIFSILPLDRVVSLGDYRGLTFRRVVPPIGLDILLVGAHLPSKLYMTEDDQALLCPRFAEKISEYEESLGHKRTIFVGDLNMNPFEKGIVAANGFHATSSRAVAKRGMRTVKGEPYTFFYNPMWGHLGDKGSKPAGTYFFDRSQLTEYFWNMYDQVLIRPDLVDWFDDKSLEVISDVAGTSLLNENSRPNKEEISDHLPIVFSLKPVRL
jgi:hypothetical protein